MTSEPEQQPEKKKRKYVRKYRGETWEYWEMMGMPCQEAVDAFLSSGDWEAGHRD